MENYAVLAKALMWTVAVPTVIFLIREAYDRWHEDTISKHMEKPFKLSKKDRQAIINYQKGTN